MTKIRVIKVIGCMVIGMSLLVGCTLEPEAFKGKVVTQVTASQSDTTTFSFKGKVVEIEMNEGVIDTSGDFKGK